MNVDGSRGHVEGAALMAHRRQALAKSANARVEGSNVLVDVMLGPPKV